VIRAAPGGKCPAHGELGDKAAVDAAFAKAAHVTKLDIINNRLVEHRTTRVGSAAGTISYTL
jgi:carbon-monoxide dehydrogenase large subunit